MASNFFQCISQCSAIAVSLLLLHLSSTGQAYAQPKKEIAAIRLNQTHYFMGTQKITIAPNAVRIDNTSQLGFTLVAKAPDWQVTLYRPDDKIFFTEPLKTFQDTGMMSEILIGRRERFLIDRPYRQSTMMLSGFKIERITSHWSTLKVLKLDGIAAPQVEKVLYAAYKLPTHNCIPLAFTATHQNTDFITGMRNRGKLEFLLDTQKIEKINVAANFFSVPANLKRAASIRDVVSGHTNRKKSEDAEIMIEK